MYLDLAEEDIAKAKKSFVQSENPLRLKEFPTKEKPKYIILQLIIQEFSQDTHYTEKEINEILKAIIPDYVMIRRALVDYRFLTRTSDGKEYWVTPVNER